MTASRVSVVLGGTGSIGGAIARRLARPGSELILGYLQDGGRAERHRQELSETGARIQLVEGNLMERATQDEIAEAVGRAGGRCDHLVHCVAVTSFKPLTATKPNQWSLILDVSARTLLDMVVRLLEPLERAGGSIVAVSSHGSTRYVPGYGALGPAKAALEASVRQLAGELAPRKVRVNAVRAGLVQGAVASRFAADMVSAVVARTPLGRLGAPEDVAGPVEFLLGADAAWITGQVLESDGGFSLT